MHYQESAVTVKKALGQLQKLAFYTGVGAKTPYGMGQTRAAQRAPKQRFIKPSQRPRRKPFIKKTTVEVLEPTPKG